MPTPLEKLTSDWQTHYSDMPLSEFVTKVHAKMYSDIPFADFTDKLGLTTPPETIKEQPSPISPIEGASPWEVGQVPPFSETVRKTAPIAAGIGAGMIPGVGGLIAGPLASTVTDMLANPKDESTGQRETSFLTDIGAGLLPGAAKGVYGMAKKLIPAPLEARLAGVIKDGFNKGVRPTIVGKSNATQAENYYEKAQTAVESIVKNKPNLSFYDDAGNSVTGILPKNLTEFAESIDQTKRSTFKQYDSMLRASNDVGRTVDLSSVSAEMRAFSSDEINLITGGSGINRARELESVMAGKKLTLIQAQDLLANLNNRTKAYLRNPSPDQVSGYAVDLLAANNLRRALDTAVENSGYMGLRREYGSLREIEKEVSNRALVDARKNTKELLDFTDIYTAAEMARAIGSMSTGGAATAGFMRGLKEYYKYLNNPNRAIKNMFSEAERLIGRRPVGPTMKALPPGPRQMGSGNPDSSYVKGVPAEYQVAADMGDIVPGSSGRDQWQELGASIYDRINRGYLGEVVPTTRRGTELGIPYENLRGMGAQSNGLLSGPVPRGILPQNTATLPAIPMPGSRNILWQAYGGGASNPAYDMTDAEFLRAVGRRVKSGKK